MAFNTTELDQATNPANVFGAEYNLLGDLLTGGILGVLFILIVARMHDEWGTKNAFLAAGAVCSLLGIFAWGAKLLSVPFLTVFIIITVISLIWRIISGP